jgi:hypothetical protein
VKVGVYGLLRRGNVAVRAGLSIRDDGGPGRRGHGGAATAASTPSSCRIYPRFGGDTLSYKASTLSLKAIP